MRRCFPDPAPLCDCYCVSLRSIHRFSTKICYNTVTYQKEGWICLVLEDITADPVDLVEVPAVIMEDPEDPVGAPAVITEDPEDTTVVPVVSAGGPAALAADPAVLVDTVPLRPLAVEVMAGGPAAAAVCFRCWPSLPQ